MVASRKRFGASRRQRKTVSYDASIDLDDDSDIEQTKRNTRDNEEDEDAEDEEINEEDEEFYLPSKRNKNQRKGQNKRQKKNNNKQSRTKSIIASNIDEIEDYTENSIFEALSSDEYNPSDLAQSWFDDFITMDLNTKFDALKDFLNFILRSSGCIVQLSRHDVTNTDNAKETINEIQTLFARQKYHEFPMMYTPIGNNKEWKDYPNNALAFISSIIVIAGESGVLYEEDDQFIELLLEWIGAMSTSNIRALRYVSTVFGLNIQSVLCKLSINISKFIDKFLRQLKRENESLKSLVDNKKVSNRQLTRQVDSANERIKVIENNVEMYKKQKKLIDNYITDFFNTLFVHRYRDVASEIRLKCVYYLGEWMEQYPEMFFESTYLRYLGWLLTDQDSNIRSEVFKVLIKLYKQSNTVAALRQFTSYFKHKLIEIVIYETDFNARYNCLQLLNEIIDKGYLDNDDNIQLTSLIFIDNEDLIYPSQGSKLNPVKFMKEIAKFISKVENNLVAEIIERDEIELENLNQHLSFDSKKIVSFKILLQILSDSYEYYISKYCASNIKKYVKNSKIEKFSNIFQFIYQLKNYNNNNENFELFLNYINYDFSAIEISRELRENIEIDSKLQYLLLNLISSATKIYAQGSENQFFKSLFPQSNKFKSLPFEKDCNFYLSKVLTKLPEICNYFHDDIEKICVLINLSNTLLKSSIAVNNKKLEESIKNLLRFFIVINFPLLSTSNPTSEYFDSITYQYILLLKNLNSESLFSELETIFNELLLIMNSKIEKKSDTIIESISKLFILSENKYLLSRVFKELTPILSVYTESLYFSVTNDTRYISESSSIPISISESKISVFLKISNDYINRSLQMFFENRDKYEDQESSTVFISTINTINVIQRDLSLLIISDNENLSIDIIHDITMSYLENIMCISAFKAEYQKTLSVDDNENSISTLRSHIGKIIQSQILKLFCIREFQYAELLGVDGKLERDALEDVNFNNYSVEINNDNDDIELINEKQEYLLCEIAAKLILCCKMGLINNILENGNGNGNGNESETENILNRVLKNADLLGELYKKILNAVNLLVQTESEANQEYALNKKKTKQIKITDMKVLRSNMKRKLIDGSEDGIDEDSMEVDDDQYEDENDPIENSDDDGEEHHVDNNNLQREDEMEFSDIDDEDDDDDEDEIGEGNENDQDGERNTNSRSSEISSFASSFPFTQ
jgi:cohesin complex subunit SA-1/2